MEEITKECKVCNETCDLKIDEYKAEDFFKHVHECKIQRAATEQTKIVTDEIYLSKKGIIRWLLLNTSQININFWDIENIVEESEKCLGGEQLLSFLLEYGVIIKTKEKYDYEANYHNALLTAAEFDCPDLLSWLVDNGASVDCFNDKYEKPLAISTKHGHLKNVIRLLNLAATSDARNIQNDCELILEKATEGNHFHILKWISRTNLLKDNGNTISLFKVLQKAIELKYYDIIEWLVNVQNMDVNESDYSNTNAVHMAAAIGNIALIKWFVEKGVPLFHKNTERKTSVHYAAENGHCELLKWLISQGGDIHERKIYGFTPLHLAASSGDVECVKLLVHHGCEVNSKDRNGKSVLHVAAEAKNLETVKFLVQHGADIHALDDERNTVAHFAVLCNNTDKLKSANNVEILQWLQENGCDLHKKNLILKSVLTNACELLEYNTVKWLLETAGLNVIDALQGTCNLTCNLNKNWDLFQLCVNHMNDINVKINDDTLLHKLASHKNAVKYLIEHKADVNSLDKELNTPLHCAIVNGAVESALLLLESGANINAKNVKGETPFHYAARNGLLSVINKLLQMGADIDVKNHKLQIPLKYAVLNGNIVIIKALIDAGSDVNSRDINGVSLVNEAAGSWQWNTVKLLVEYGANINYTNNNNRTRNILQHAISTHDVDLIKWLLDHGATGLNDVPRGHSSILHSISYIHDQNKKIKLIKLLIEHGADINGLDHSGNSILLDSVTNPKIVEYLIRNGANVNLQNEYGLSALHKVAQCYHYANHDTFRQECFTLKLLLSSGANINAKDRDGKIPLHEAAYESSVNLTRILISHGSDISCKDNKGNTCLYYSSTGEVAHYLCENGADINAKNHEGVSVLQNSIKLVSTVSNKRYNVVHIINSRTVNSNMKNSYAKDIKKSIRLSRNRDYLEYLIKNVKDINDVDNEGATALHVAAEVGVVYIFNKLIEAGANVNIRSKKGDTILHTAARHGQVNIVKYILQILNFKSLLTPNNENKTPIHNAVESDCNKIVELLVQHENLNHKNNEMLTAIHIAIQCKNIDLVKVLVINGANIYEIGSNSYTPVHFAAKSCKLDILEYLVAIDVNILQCKTDTGETLLHLATKFGRFDNVPNEVVKYLIDRNVYPIDTVDKYGNTALHYACGTFMVDIVTMLVENGANINLQNNIGNTPFHFAAKTGSIDIINYLLEKNGDMNINNKRGNNSVQISASHSKINPTECLLQRGANLSKKNRKGICVIHQLAISGGLYLFQYLVKNFKTADVNILNNKKQTPLALAMKYPTKTKNIELLINEKSVNSQDARGNTPMHEACRYRNLDAIDLLFANGAKINLQNNKGDTALHIAAYKLEPDVVKSLLPYFLKKITNNLGMNILHSAVSGNNVEVVKILITIFDKSDKTNRGDTVLHIASKNTDTETFNWLIENCNELINVCNNDNETVLHTCLKLSHHNVNTIEFLLANGADLNYINANGDNVLHISTGYGRIDFVNYMIQKNVNVNERNNLGNCALHIAAENGYLDILKVLIDKGSNVNCRNFKDMSPLHYAAKCGQMSVMKYLVEKANCDVNIRNNENKLAVDLAKEYNQDSVVNWFVSYGNN